MVNQVNFNPFSYRRALLRECDERGIVLEAYSPLGTGRHLAYQTVGQIAEQRGVSPAQVLLRWCVQREIPVISKSTKRARIEENGRIFDFELTDPEMAALDALDVTGGTNRASEHAWW
jgi:2,5-diketo-D-gluconate reductase A